MCNDRSRGHDDLVGRTAASTARAALAGIGRRTTRMASSSGVRAGRSTRSGTMHLLNSEVWPVRARGMAGQKASHRSCLATNTSVFRLRVADARSGRAAEAARGSTECLRCIGTTLARYIPTERSSNTGALAMREERQFAGLQRRGRLREQAGSRRRMDPASHVPGSGVIAEVRVMFGATSRATISSCRCSSPRGHR
jgi:hypothetical protein